MLETPGIDPKPFFTEVIHAPAEPDSLFDEWRDRALEGNGMQIYRIKAWGRIIVYNFNSTDKI